MTWTSEQVATIVRKQLRVRGVIPDSDAERIGEAVIAALIELYPALTLPGPVQMLRVGRDDVIAVGVDRLLSMEEADELTANAKRAFPDHRIVVLDQAELTVVRPTTQETT